MTDTKTYRGRTVEEVLPQIREELGPEALILARREGLSGGVGGFFQRSYVEVDARGPAVDPKLELRTDRATAEGMSTPGIQALLAQASPFASQLAAAQGLGTGAVATATAAPAVAMPHPIAGEAIPVAGLYGPQPATAEATHAAAGVTDAAAEAMAILAGEGPSFVAAVSDELAAPGAPAPALPALFAPAPAAAAVPVDAPAAAATLTGALEVAGLPAAMAAEIVDEAVRHGIPFASPRGLKGLVRTALARRIPVMGPLGTGPRTVAIVGPAAAGKTTAAKRLAAAYRGAGMPVRELGAGDPTSREPFEGLTVLDVPATGVRDAERIKEVARTLRGIGAEIHLALPATISGSAISGLAKALAPLKVTHVLLTHADETDHPGAPVAHAIAAGLPLSYVSGADALAPADAAELAKRLAS